MATMMSVIDSAYIHPHQSSNTRALVLTATATRLQMMTVTQMCIHPFGPLSARALVIAATAPRMPTMMTMMHMYVRAFPSVVEYASTRAHSNSYPVANDDRDTDVHTSLWAAECAITRAHKIDRTKGYHDDHDAHGHSINLLSR
jgi:hypothetical protein